MININQRTKTETFFLILMLGALNTITPISIDMYLPAFPEIAADLHTTINNVALSVSTYFLGFSAGQILYGPLLDRFGRKRPLYIGLSLYIVATIACITSHTITALLVWRFIQALSGCVAAVASLAMVRDFFPADKSAGIISLLILILGVSPLLAPTIGGFIVSYVSWHWIFITLAAIAFIVLIIIMFFLPEGHPPDVSVSLLPKAIIKDFTSILTNPRFIVYALAGTFSFAALFVYVAGSPAIFMDRFHTTPKVYGGIFAFLSIGFIGSSQLTHTLTRKFSNEDIFKTAVIIQVIASLFFVMGELKGWYDMPVVIAFLFVILSCAGLTYPNAAAIAISPFTKNAGSASALLGFIQIGIGGLISSGVGILHFKSSASTSLIMTGSALVALIILFAGQSRAAKSKAVVNAEL